MKYVIITPAKNESKYIEYTLNSVCNQTLKPVEYIVVDDGSDDDTYQIVEKYQKDFFWLKIIRNQSEGEKRAGGVKVIRAFNYGFENLDNRDFEFIVKLDADLTLPLEYFENVSKCFRDDPKVGMCGGYCVEEQNGNWVRTVSAHHHLNGAFKAYRTNCFNQMGGIPMLHNWDGIDEMKARFLGWKVQILDLPVKHHRVTSTLINKGMKAAFKTGMQYHKSGYDLFLSLLKAMVFGKNYKPVFLSGVSFFAGFLYALISFKKRDVEPGFAKFIRSFQYERIKQKLKF